MRKGVKNIINENDTILLTTLIHDEAICKKLKSLDINLNIIKINEL